MLSPPFFNFEASYTEGQVMGFRLGTSKRETAQILSDKYLTVATFHSGCGSLPPTRPYKFLKFGDEDEFWEWA